jgi:UDP-N-acetylmuramyl pentapeptide phosphotransferase/UDP-N-acetylglucosamine-1-phosphate transferase
MIHMFSALLIVWDAGFFQTVYLPFLGQINFGYGGIFFTLFWIVWLTNAYNFMDGIDGLAGLQAFTAGIGWLVAGKILGINEAAFYGGVVAFSCAGFLFHNWEPAKIFMGDVGSAFLGFTFSVLPLLARNEKPEYGHILPIIGVLLLWLFIFDSVFTLVRRTLKKEKIWEAHREHVYQKLVIKGYSHRFVTGLYGVNSSIILGYVLIWLYLGNHFLRLVLLPITVQSLGILFLSYKKHIFLKS